MKLLKTSLSVLFGASLLSGCATWVNRVSDSKDGYPLAAEGCYQAASDDVLFWCMCCVSSEDNRWFAADYGDPLQWIITPVVTVCVLPDLLFSAVLDTMFLPLDLWANK